MKINNLEKNYNKKFYFGISILFVLILFYFIPIRIESGTNYITNDTLLGIIIMHNPFILGLYILASIYLIFKGTRK